MRPAPPPVPSSAVTNPDETNAPSPCPEIVAPAIMAASIIIRPPPYFATQFSQVSVTVPSVIVQLVPSHVTFAFSTLPPFDM